MYSYKIFKVIGMCRQIEKKIFALFSLLFTLKFVSFIYS
ncbi:MAG: hypothetical protein C5S47_00250 [Candidatus Methanogasteraceae archaeon]|nr:MAG: hypothetical protein C5S47_00250 [ANME-2 cluster archaeon]